MQRLTVLISTVLVLTVLLGLTVLVLAQEKKMAGMSSIEGTWQFVSRKLPDGTTVMPPMCIGLQNYADGMRNFNIGWVDSAGKHNSYSVIASYKLTDKEYSETILYSCMIDETGMMRGRSAGPAPAFVMQSETKTAPVTMSGSKMTFQMPFDLPQVVFDGNNMTATLPGGIVDTWKRLP